MTHAYPGISRRRFLRETLATTIAIGGATNAGAVPVAPQSTTPATPWYRRAYLWGQTNITEKDPVRYDIAWWREHWKRTGVQAVIINAGGIVAYYPSKFPLHHRAQFLGDRDLFGELTKAAHDDGLFVMARMDSNRAAADFFEAHPDWFARDAEGKPYRAADKYIACINTPYYDEYLPGVLREIVERSHPDGFTDNSWAGLGRESICFCASCERTFRAKTGLALPRRANWDDPAYRAWILWSYARRVEVWELNNRTTREAGGPHCIWSGMNSGSVTAQARSFRDLKEICTRADIMMLDHQRRDDDTGFQQNGDTGKRVHGLLGWDKIAPESMAMYQSGPGYYRVASKPAAEARMWMIAGIAGGIQPWWHHVAAYHEDRRMYRTAEPVMRWWKAHEAVLTDRTPIANVGVVWSQRNTDFFGRDDAPERVDAAVHGLHARAGPGPDSVPPGACRRHRSAREQSGRARSPERRRPLGCAGRVRPAVRRTRRIARRDRRHGLVRRVGRSPAGLRACGSVRLAPDPPGTEVERLERPGGIGRGPRRVCAECGAPYLPEADSRAAGARRRSEERRRAGGHRRAPPGPAGVRRDRPPAVRRFADAVEGRGERDRPAHLRPALPDLPARDGVDARAGHRHSGIDPLAPWALASGVHAGGRRSPIRARASPRSWPTAREHRAVGGRRPLAVDGRRRRPDRLPSLRAARPNGPSISST